VIYSQPFEFLRKVEAVIHNWLLRFAGVCVFVLFAVTLASRADAQGEGGIMVYSIQVLGNENVSSEYIISLLTIHAGDYIGSNAYTVLEKNADILEKTGYFRERPTLSYEGYQSGAMLVVEVKEWPLFKEIRFTGNSLYTNDELVAALNDYVTGRGDDVRTQKLNEAKAERKRQEKELKKKEKESNKESTADTVSSGSEPASDATEVTEESGVELPEIPEFDSIEVTEEDLWGGNPPLVPGKIISSKTLEWILVNGILGHYNKNGYIAAWIRDFNIGLEGDNTGVITIEVGEGYVDEVLVSGYTNTKERIIRREITSIKIGEPLTEKALEADFRRLVNTGLFEEVNFSWEPSIKPGHVKMIFDITEARTGQFGFGAAYSTVNGFQGTISYRENNLFGEAKTLSSTLIFSQDDPGFQIEYRDPNLQSRDISVSANVFSLHSRQQRNPGSVKESELKLDSWGGSVGFGKKFTEQISGNLSFNVTESRYDVIKGDPFVNYTPVRRSRLMQEGQTRSITFAGYYDTRDNKFSTKEGGLLGLQAEFAGFGGDFDYRKYTQEYRYFIPIGDKNTIGFRERVGFAEGDLPLYEEFRLGGAYSIRGITEDALTGSKSVLLNTELRYAIDKKEQFTLALFSDWGWAGENFDGMDGAKGVGVGIHFDIPQLGLGAIRLDYGWQIGGDGGDILHFGIGEMF
jgi:outer membrane protein assembly factor BamA